MAGENELNARLDLASGITSRQKRKLRAKRKENVVVQDDGEGNWLISYADMMTLLFALFVIISAFSTPDAGKFEKLKEATTKAMGVEYVKPFTELSNDLKKIVKSGMFGSGVSVDETSEGIVISASGTLFFDSGSTDLKDDAARMIDNISTVLSTNAKGFRVVVEGHTDDVPMNSEKFPSNWELSSGRAGTVVRRLEEKGFPHALLRPLGLADAEPLVPNHNERGVALPENRARNRRIVIRIQKQLPQRMKKPVDQP
ncbi:MAG: hypothetical protein A2583_04965 [Bdellovibrionales bacterium RIFOXYD1_FULL_53_11]|nr:MAG: hypothetical protein A2583_04965 [Bdellovibrionales bacterium RIFOXYD1_FULL_53_11]